MVSTKCKFPGTLDSLSILVYNFDEEVGKGLRKVMTEEELLKVVKQYDEDIEFLVRCNGLSGDFRILRYRYEKENIALRLEHELNHEKMADQRDIFINKLLSEAFITSGSYTSSDALSLRTTFKGIGAELILIDRK
jgi:hypothetical protein